jgi:glycosyltransferase involved in cell wall biosynthesis
MKILFITQYFPPEKATITSTIAQAMVDRGHEARVLTGFPNYPDGKIFEGYSQRWRQREKFGDLDVLRVPLYADHSLNPVARTANYASFGLSAATARAFAKDVDVIYLYASQMTPALGPWLWRMFGGAPYVLHVQDLWPDSITGSSLVGSSRAGKTIDAVLNPWLKSTYQRAAGVVGIAPTMAETLISRGAPADKTSVIYNWADENEPVEHKPAPASDPRTRFLYAGNIGDMQDLETVVRAAKLSEDAPVKVDIVGGGVALERVKGVAAELEVNNVEFHDFVAPEKMPEIYANADFSLVTLKDLPNFRGTVPSKFQASIAEGIPVVTTVQGDLRGLVEDMQLGFTAEAEDAESLAEAMRRAASLDGAEYKQLRTRARDTYYREFSLESGLDALEKVFLNAAGAQKRQKMMSK